MSTLLMVNTFLESSRKLFNRKRREILYNSTQSILHSPFDVGFEALGEIVAVGSSVPKEKIGSHVIYTQYGAFAEYVEISAKAVMPVPVSNWMI